MKKLLLRTIGILALVILTPFASAHAAKMALSPGNTEFKAGCTNRLDIIVNTEGENTTAADAFLSYNPDEIEIIDQSSAASGIQLRAGKVYESYPGNIVSNGTIRLTAFNRTGYFNGRGVLASIIFRSKPGVQKSSIWFNFSPGRSTDSNVADVGSQDILNAAYGGTYTFKPNQACFVDLTPPEIVKRYPDDGAVQAPLDADIAFIITDNLSGVDIDKVKINIDGTEYTKSGENQFTYEGKPSEYKIVADPEENFRPNKPVNVKIDVQDMEGNATSGSHSFNKLIPVEECKAPEPEECPDEKVCPKDKICPDIRPAAPPKLPTTLLLILLFLLAISLLLNLDLILRVAAIHQKTEGVELFAKRGIRKQSKKRRTKKRK